MAKKRRGRDITNQSLKHRFAPTRFISVVPTSPIKTNWSRHAVLNSDPIADGRAYRPDPIRIRGVVRANAANLRITKGAELPRGIRFAVPKHIALCVRRKRRREIMHALRRAGRRGIGKNKIRRTNFWSKVKC